MGHDLLAGKVGRIYMPKQTVDKVALKKMKGVKRERRAAAADKAEGKKAVASKKAKPDAEPAAAAAAATVQ